MSRAVRLSVRSMEMREVAMPLVRPFRTSFGEERQKRALLVRIEAATTDAEGGGSGSPPAQIAGWGECVAAPEPRYSEETIEGARVVIRDHLWPAIAAGGPVTGPEDVQHRLRWVRGHRMARATMEAAFLDAWLRASGETLAGHLGGVRDRVACGVSVGIAPSIDVMLEEIAGYLEAGYQRVKLKIEPGRDVQVVGAVRSAFPDTPLSVDANAAYSLTDTALFEALDEQNLVMIEQPLDHEDLLDHAKLQSRLATPICLDESIRSVRDAAAAIEVGACRVINIKQGRVGGVAEARRVHDVCLDQGVPVWIGGMLETGIGRAVNLALASLPGVTMPGDTSASDRYFTRDLTDPFMLEADGTMAVPAGPGIGVEPHPDRLEDATLERTMLFAKRPLEDDVTAL
jgi:o-succinylbenzoate synthase